MNKKLYHKIEPYIWIAPSVILMAVFIMTPILSVFRMASSVDDEVPGAGLDDQGGGPGEHHDGPGDLAPLELVVQHPLTVATVLNIIYVFNSFPIIWTMTKGDPANHTDTLVTYLYKLSAPAPPWRHSSGVISFPQGVDHVGAGADQQDDKADDRNGGGFPLLAVVEGQLVQVGHQGVGMP